MPFTQHMLTPTSGDKDWLKNAEEYINKQLAPFQLSLDGPPILVDVDGYGGLILRWRVTSEWD